VNRSTTILFSNVPNGSLFKITLILTQNAVGNTINWGANVFWGNTGVPTLSTSGKTDIINLFTTNGGTKWFAYIYGLGF